MISEGNKIHNQCENPIKTIQRFKVHEFLKLDIEEIIFDPSSEVTSAVQRVKSSFFFSKGYRTIDIPTRPLFCCDSARFLTPSQLQAMNEPLTPLQWRGAETADTAIL